MTDASPRRRVSPLTPEDRRAAIIAATLPLLRAEGLHVSSKRIAECAGVAEGTIFRAFPDKAALISATLSHAFDPAPTIESIKAVAGDPDLRFRLKTAVRILTRRFRDNAPLMMSLRSSGLAVVTTAPVFDPREALTGISDAVAELIADDADSFRLPPQTVASLLISMVFFNNRSEILPEDQIVDVVLDGVLSPEAKKEPAC
ncbi:TetR/AcrR family transcriptional regulator [Catellatospora methionotrophica]|uniref:TetR/AcrR family transcriptional regulator n=1 Tax=Catellatospora methionotrophica TaxID=121620 RepID=UPI0019448F4E|nr:TetR/AcrR family transcriptional regulator [Catellatospora methionotrophica]